MTDKPMSPTELADALDHIAGAFVFPHGGEQTVKEAARRLRESERVGAEMLLAYAARSISEADIVRWSNNLTAPAAYNPDLLTMGDPCPVCNSGTLGQHEFSIRCGNCGKVVGDLRDRAARSRFPAPAASPDAGPTVADLADKYAPHAPGSHITDADLAILAGQTAPVAAQSEREEAARFHDGRAEEERVNGDNALIAHYHDLAARALRQPAQSEGAVATLRDVEAAIRSAGSEDADLRAVPVTRYELVRWADTIAAALNAHPVAGSVTDELMDIVTKIAANGMEFNGVYHTRLKAALQAAMKGE